MKSLRLSYILFVIIPFTILFPKLATAHSGGTDAYGGHNCNVGSCEGTYHYHNGGNYYETPVAPKYSCKVDGQSYSSAVSAQLDYQQKIRKIVSNVYIKHLERNANSGDYGYWYKKYNADDSFSTLIDSSKCNFIEFQESDVVNEIINSPEYKKLQVVNSFKQKVLNVFIENLDRLPSDDEMNYYTKAYSNVDSVEQNIKSSEEYNKLHNPFIYYANMYKWWIIGVIAYMIYAYKYQ